MCNRAGSSGFSEELPQAAQFFLHRNRVEHSPHPVESTRVGHLHVTGDDLLCYGDFPANDGSIVVAGLPACLHKVLVPTLLTTTCIPRERCIHNFKHRISFHSN